MRGNQPTVVEILQSAKPLSILDMPSGNGWLRREIPDSNVAIDGIDLYKEKPLGYRALVKVDLDDGIPDSLPQYDAIVSCEGIEHLANPGLLLTSAHKHLRAGGLIVITTPNTWYPGARMQYLHRGFFPSFPALVGRVQRGTHMHIMPWSWPQLYLYLALAGFSDIRLHTYPDRRTRWVERLAAVPMTAYYRGKVRKANSAEERRFWETCASPAAIFARGLTVSGRKA